MNNIDQYFSRLVFKANIVKLKLNLEINEKPLLRPINRLPNTSIIMGAISFRDWFVLMLLKLPLNCVSVKYSDR